MGNRPDYFHRNKSWVYVSLIGVACLLAIPASRLIGHPLEGSLPSSLRYIGWALVALSLGARTFANRVLNRA